MGTLDLEQARTTLRDDRDRLTAKIGRLGGVAKAETGPDPIDVGSAVAARNADLAVLDNTRTRLAAVETALAAIDDGTYGTCQGCGGPIDADRLDCLPATVHCQGCTRR